MHFLVDVASAVPLYAQIVGQVRAGVASELLKSGDPLPSVRQLASELRINPNTVVQAYRELEREGFTVAQRGQGTFIAELPEDRRHDERARVARELVERMLAEAGRVGLNQSEVRAALDEALERLENH
jgi:GntR family transcriptional regulator